MTPRTPTPTPTAVRNGYLFVLAAAVLWGTTGTAQAFAPAGATPPIIGALRLVIGGGLLIVLAWRRGMLRAPQADLRLAWVMGASGVVAYQFLFFGGVSLAGVAVGTMVGIGSSPIFAGLLDTVFNQRPLSQRWYVATTLAVIGCMLISLPNGGEDQAVKVDLLGVLMAIGAGASYALYALAGQRLLRDHHPDAMGALIFGLAMVMMIPILFMGDVRWALQPVGIIVILWLGIGTLALSYLLFGRGLLTTPLSTTVTLSLAEPLTAALLGVFVVREQLPPIALVGIAFLFAGLWWLTRPSSLPT